MGIINKITNIFNSEPNFGYLEKVINSSQNEEIMLDSDIILGNGEEKKYAGGIFINKNNMIINGKGHAIDAKGKSRIFNINGKNIVFKNIRFLNGFHMQQGGAIFNHKYSEISFINCDFENNCSKKDGGVIFNDGKIDVRDSKFENNMAENGGTIVNHSGRINLLNSSFEGNMAQNMNQQMVIQMDLNAGKSYKNPAFGGAIDNYSGAKVTAKSCNFYNNHAETGGAIWTFFKDDVVLEDCLFKDNKPENMIYNHLGDSDNSDNFLGIIE